MEHLNVRSTGAALVVMACLFLAACGGTAAAGGTSAPRTTPTSTPHLFALNGCSAQTPPPGAPAADVVVTQGGGLNNPAVSLRTGQRLEVQLPASKRWGLAIQDAAHTLAPQPGNGWLDVSAHACVWQFTASGVGRATLLFTGRLVCPPGAMCPAFVIERQVAVAVAA